MLPHRAKIKTWTGRAEFLPEAPRENPFLCLLQLLETTYIPTFMAPSLTFRTGSAASSNISLILTVPPTTPFF